MVCPIGVQHPRSVSRTGRGKELDEKAPGKRMGCTTTWSGVVSVILLSTVSTKPQRPTKANLSTKWALTIVA